MISAGNPPYLLFILYSFLFVLHKTLSPDQNEPGENLFLSAYRSVAAASAAIAVVRIAEASAAAVVFAAASAAVPAVAGNEPCDHYSDENDEQPGAAVISAVHCLSSFLPICYIICSDAAVCDRFAQKRNHLDKIHGLY